MLFGLGVIGGLPSIFPKLPSVGGPSIGDLDFDGKPVSVAGIDYFSDSISTKTMMVQKNNTNNTDTNPDKNDTVIIPGNNSNTAFQFPPVIPIPPIVQPNQSSTQSVDPIITSPVETAPVNSTPIVSVPT